MGIFSLKKTRKYSVRCERSSEKTGQFLSFNPVYDKTGSGIWEDGLLAAPYPQDYGIPHRIFQLPSFSYP